MKKCVIWLALMVLCGFTITVAAANTWEEPVALTTEETTVQTEAGTDQYLDEWIPETESEYYEDEVWVPDVVSEYANTYGTIMVVDLTNQHAYCCVNGEVIADADCVSGDLYSSPTPTGLYSVWYKRSDFYMRDVYYTSYAAFFNGEIALHDADAWRSEYGGAIYQGNGSHGCINLPRKARGDSSGFFTMHSFKPCS